MMLPKKICTVEELKEFNENPVKFVSRLSEEFDDIVEVEVGKNVYIFPFKPEFIKKIMEARSVGRTSFSNLFAPIAGGSLILDEGEEWKEKRRMLSPFFYMPPLSPDRIKELAEKALKSWEYKCDDGIVDGRQMVTFYCISVLSELIFGYALDKHEMEEIYENWNRALDCFTKSMSDNATDLDIAEMEKACIKIESTFLDFIRKGYKYENSILSYLQIKINDEETIMKNIKGLFMAGFETISGALSWLIAELAENQEWQNKVREQVLQSGFEIVEDVGIIKQCYDETVRLHPPLVFIDRAIRAEIEVGQYCLPKDAEVLICPYVIHRDKKYWKEGNEFRPDRDEIEKYASDESYRYFPYGGGMMKCMGEKLSVLERNALLQVMLKRYQFMIADGYPIEEDNALVLRPKEVMLTLREI